MLKNQWHEKLSFSNKILRTIACLFASIVTSFLIVNTWFLLNETSPKINIVTVILFATFFYFSFKKMRALPPPDCNITVEQKEFDARTAISDPSNPYFTTTPESAGYLPFNRDSDYYRNRNMFD